MEGWRRLMLCLITASVTFLPVGSAFGTTVSGKSSFVVEWFDDANEETAIPVYEYLMLNVKDIANEGYNFRGYGRLADDITQTVVVDSRLYYAYLEKKALGTEDLDVRFGRQFITTAAGHSIIDGLYLKYKNVGPVHLSLYGGGDVAYYESYDAEDLIWGAEVAGRFFDGLDMGLSYIQKWGDSEITHEVIGLTGDYDYKDTLNVYTDLQYSWITKEFTYALTGFKYHRSKTWGLRGEYLYSLPVFSSTSIYSVFATAEYQEALAELTYKICKGLNTFFRFTREFYDEFDDANVYELGVEQIRVKRFSGYLIGTFRDDEEGQDMEGVKCRVGYLVSQSLDAGIGVHYDVMERRLDDQDDETTSSRFWIDSTMYFTKKVSVQAKLERVESDIWDEYFRGRIRINLKF